MKERTAKQRALLIEDAWDMVEAIKYKLWAFQDAGYLTEDEYEGWIDGAETLTNKEEVRFMLACFVLLAEGEEL